MTPFIGITTYRNLKKGGYYLPDGYVESVRRAGGVPLLLTPGETNIDKILSVVHGLIFAGGGDIDPAIFGGEEHPSVNRVDPVRDNFELALAQKVFNSDLPVLGICRGFQLLAVATGSKLVIHIPEEIGTKVLHKDNDGNAIKHQVRIEKDSRLAAIVGGTKIEVASNHHQAVRSFSGAWRVVAEADDGIMEAIEHKQHPWMISVLWHPEVSLEDQVNQNIFKAQVEAAKR